MLVIKYHGLHQRRTVSRRFWELILINPRLWRDALTLESVGSPERIFLILVNHAIIHCPYDARTFMHQHLLIRVFKPVAQNVRFATAVASPRFHESILWGSICFCVHGCTTITLCPFPTTRRQLDAYSLGVEATTSVDICETARKPATQDRPQGRPASRDDGQITLDRANAEPEAVPCIGAMIDEILMEEVQADDADDGDTRYRCSW